MEKEEKAFRKLIVWKRAHAMTLAVYKASQNFPRHELFGLTSQNRRSSTSVGANIADGYALGSSANYLCHLHIAFGSLAETEYHLELAHDLCNLADVDYSQLIDLAGEVGGLLSRLKAFHRTQSQTLAIRHIRYIRNFRNSNVNQKCHPNHRFRNLSG